MTSIHKFKVEGIDGKEINFADFQGKKILIVNVASECGYTKQYQQLQELYKEFNDKLVIIGFPCNDFGQQEPGSNESIISFCSINYGVTFPMSTKISVTAPKKHPIYRWLTEQALNGKMDTEVQWNFHKFLLDENGFLINSFPSSVEPNQEEILNLIMV